jgi:Fe-S-cluster containining protein
VKPVPIPIPLPLAPAELVPCTRCAKCCTYVGVGINAPHSVRYATDVLWYLYHHNVSVHRDADGEWMVVFETRCKHLQDDLLCGVYEQRPVVCREFDNTGCEVNAPGGGHTFTEPAQFLEWLRRRRPRVYEKIARQYVPPSLERGARRRAR